MTTNMDVDRLASIEGTGSARRIELKTVFNARITMVWEAITRMEHVQQWWAGGTLEAREGGRVVLGDGSEVNGTVKICAPPYCFAFTWNDKPERAAHPKLIEPSTRSLLKIDLTEFPARTGLTLVQYAPASEAIAAAAGWHHIVGERLRDYVEIGSVLANPRRFRELRAIYQSRPPR